MDKQSFSLNTKTILFILAICIGNIFFNNLVCANDLKLSGIDKQDIQKLFTQEEQSWLLRHKTIRIAGPKSFPPFHYYEQGGNLKGMASDYISLILSYLNIQPDIKSNMSWSEVLKGAKERNIDLISCTAKTRERGSYLLFTHPYLSFPLVIITKTDSPFIGGVNDLNDKTLATIKGNAAYDWIRRDNIKVIPYSVKTPLDGLRAVSLGHAQAHIENLAAASYLIQKHGLANLKIAAPAFNENYNLYIAVRKDWPELVPIINKILAAITPQQHSQIRNRWLSIEYEYGIRKADVIKWILGIICTAMIILGLTLIWNRRLRKEIIERKKAQEELMLERTFIDAIFDSIPGILYLYDVEGNLIRWNKKHELVTGYSAQELSKMHLLDWYKGDMESQEAVGEGLKNTLERGFGDAEVNLQKKDGAIVPFYFTASPLTINGKQYFTGIGIDITERKRAEEEKRIAQKMTNEHEKLAFVGQIAGRMAHDFNNILGIIMGNTQLLISRNPDDKIKEKLDLIINQTLRGRNLTKNLVAFGKDQEPKQAFFKINEKIDLVLALMKKDLENISLNRSDAFDVPDLLADPGMIEHAIVNLLQNSIHALSLSPRPEITIKTFYREGHIFIQIKDNGCGMREAHLKSIYAPSFSLKGSRDTTGSYSSLITGTGYGMANVKKYIEQHRGSISVESELGVGTQITLRLPVINKELTAEEKKMIEERQICPGQRILLVEDEVDISDVQYTILSDSPCNHHVDVAHNGHMALDLFDRNSYDFVSLDYILPGDINGMEIYHHIRGKNSEIPILFTSGNLEFLQSIKDLKAKDKMIDHISKPCQNKEYLDQINKMLDRRNN